MSPRRLGRHAAIPASRLYTVYTVMQIIQSGQRDLSHAGLTPGNLTFTV